MEATAIEAPVRAGETVEKERMHSVKDIDIVRVHVTLMDKPFAKSTQ